MIAALLDAGARFLLVGAGRTKALTDLEALGEG
jgi:hypothetical protein